jgi:PPE-repeat protein
MDFAALPPEVNSGRMYAGAGAGPMLAAASAWERLAVELGSAAKAYESVVAGFTGQEWLGPASESMAAAAVRYAGWLGVTAAQAEQTAVQARAAAAAYEAAFAAMVPPPVIAANRSRLASLVASNVLGQNSAAIAATEAEYYQMWVQDAATMYGYAGRSAAAAAVTPFAEPPATTDPGGQAGAVAQASAGSAHSQLSQLVNAIPQALHGLSPAQATPPPPPMLSLSQSASYVETVARSILPANDANISVLYGQAQFARNLTTDLDIAAADKAAAGSVSRALTPTGSTVSAGIGNAGMVGKLSVPAGWTAITPEVKMTAATLPDASPAAAPAAAAAGPGAAGDVFADMAVAALAGRAIAGSVPGSRPAAVANRDAQRRLERLAAELPGTHGVQHWHNTDPGQLKGMLAELAQQPGVHEVHLNPDTATKPAARPQLQG